MMLTSCDVCFEFQKQIATLNELASILNDVITLAREEWEGEQGAGMMHVHVTGVAFSSFPLLELRFALRSWSTKRNVKEHSTRSSLIALRYCL